MFVSESRLIAADKRAAEWRDLYLAKCEEYNSLLAKYHELKVQGAAKVEPVVGLPKRTDDPVMDAIALAAGNDMERRKYLGALVRRWRIEGRDDDQIVHDLLNWQVVGEEDEA